MVLNHSDTCAPRRHLAMSEDVLIVVGVGGLLLAASG